MKFANPFWNPFSREMSKRFDLQVRRVELRIIEESGDRELRTKWKS